MTNLLIPTDFSVASLQMAGQAVRALGLKGANVILFHAFDTTSLGYELLGANRKPYADLLTDSFRHNCKLFREQHPDSVGKVFVKLMEGSSPALFRNFADANEIDLIFCPDDYPYAPVHALSVDPRPLFRKSGIRTIREVTERRQEERRLPQGATARVALATS